MLHVGREQVFADAVEHGLQDLGSTSVVEKCPVGIERWEAAADPIDVERHEILPLLPPVGARESESPARKACILSHRSMLDQGGPTDHSMSVSSACS